MDKLTNLASNYMISSHQLFLPKRKCIWRHQEMRTKMNLVASCPLLIYNFTTPNPFPSYYINPFYPQTSQPNISTSLCWRRRGEKSTMRPSLVFHVVIKAAAAPAAADGTGLGQTHSAWHSPVPYLFGGLAAMLGLIAFALLILACSYWKLSGYLESGGDGEGDEAPEGDMEKVAGEGYVKKPAAFFEGIVVIMAGDEKPTFLATPMSSRTWSIGSDHSSSSSSSSRSINEKKVTGLDEEKKIDEVASISIPIEEEQDQLSQEQDV